MSESHEIISFLQQRYVVLFSHVNNGNFPLYTGTGSVFNYLNKIQKHFQNVMLVGMASENSKNYTYKCVDRSRHNGIKGARLNLHTNQILAHTFSHGTLVSVVS